MADAQDTARELIERANQVAAAAPNYPPGTLRAIKSLTAAVARGASIETALGELIDAAQAVFEKVSKDDYEPYKPTLDALRAQLIIAMQVRRSQPNEEGCPSTAGGVRCEQNRHPRTTQHGADFGGDEGFTTWDDASADPVDPAVARAEAMEDLQHALIMGDEPLRSDAQRRLDQVP